MTEKYRKVIIKEFIKRLKTDKECDAEFKEYLTAKNAKVKEGARQISEQLNKLVF